MTTATAKQTPAPHPLYHSDVLHTIKPVFSALHPHCRTADRCSGFSRQREATLDVYYATRAAITTKTIAETCSPHYRHT